VIISNNNNTKIKISIIGSGPSALMLAAELDENIFDIHIYEKGNAAGRKFLVAGHGGFNLTHSESPETFIHKYNPVEFIKPFFIKFNNIDTRKWFENLGIKTFVGSSKRVYPEKGIKPNQVLNAIMLKLKQKKVKFHFNHKWTDFDKNYNPVFIHKNTITTVNSNIVVFALGGGSWKITGSDGQWINIFRKYNIETIDFQPSNCAVKIDWNKHFLADYEGKPVKNIAIYNDNKYIKGEFVITKSGMEGAAIYAHSSALGKQLTFKKSAYIFIDLMPYKKNIDILNKIITSKSSKSKTTILKNILNLDRIKISLLKQFTSKAEFHNDILLVKKIKKLPIEIIGIASLDEAISTIGGLSLKAIDENLKIKKLPFHYAIGEMLDWDAPTGGYLLQASFSMGYFLAHHLNSINIT